MKSGKRITINVLESIRFGLLYRKLALNDNDVSTLNETEKEIYLAKNKISIIDVDENLIFNGLNDIFLKSSSSQILWLYRCIYDEQGCFLHKLSPYMKDISKITRGGLNVYKRIGWDIHVLYVYQLICDNFIDNKSTGVIGATNDFSMYQEIMNSLDDESLFILKISAFLHDIGVVDGVKDHEINGVKWVEKRFNEIGFNRDILCKIGIFLSYEEIYSILKFIVGNHQMINQIGSEISDKYIFNKIKDGQNSLEDKGLHFFNSNIAKIMYLLSAADLMGVDDLLLTSEKHNETEESLEYVEKILINGFYERDTIKYGIQRFRSLLNDTIKTDFSDEAFKENIDILGYNSNKIASFIYHIPQMSYAMTFVKPQKKYLVGLKMFCLIYEKMSRENIDIKDTKLKFDPDINACELGSYIEKNSINEILEEKKVKFTYFKEEGNMNISYTADNEY